MGTTWQKALSERHFELTKDSIIFDPPPKKLAPSAWFLGPNAENLDILERLIGIALKGHAGAREAYSQAEGRKDPDMAERGEEFEPTVAAIERNLEKILNELRGSIPLSSHRNQSHMYWDITMPGAAGYFAGMLFNQNNVAAEASPVTTGLELLVARQLCEMLGLRRTKTLKPWGHITCDGSVANLEAMWAARNLKYLPAALARAIRVMPDLFGARGLTVTMPDGREARLLDLDVWELLNIGVDETLALQRRLVDECHVAEDAVRAGVDTFSIAALGAAAFNADILQGAVPAAPAILVPATAHYSWMKGATILGLGTRSVIRVPVDLDGRMIVSELNAQLNKCHEKKCPVIQVVAVLGTTEESAVDPLDQILKIRERHARRGLTFALHADAAWGGYFTSMLRKPPEIKLTKDSEQTGYDDNPGATLSPHVQAQFEALPDVDTVTIDPHKSGYIPYPAGSLCYRNEEMIYLVAHTAPVVFHSESIPTVGVYGVEGSKPGAAAVGVALSHASVPPDKSGYGRLLGRCIFNSKRFYAAVTTLAEEHDDFIVVPFNRLPVERDGKATPRQIEKQRAHIRERFVGISNKTLRERLDADKELLDLFRSLGPDLTVFAYAFNYKRRDGTLNDDLARMNEFNDMLFDAMSVQVAGKAGETPKEDMFVTSSQFPPEAYGGAFTDTFARRAGVEPMPKTAVHFLISTMQNPFVTHTADPKDGSSDNQNFLPRLMKVLRSNIEAAREAILDKYDTEAGA